jgi:uncharacterized protein
MNIDIFQLARLGETSELIKLKDTGFNLNEINERGGNIIHAAIAYGKPDTAIQTIRLGVDINKQTNNGETPLHLACDYKQFEVCKELISKGADIDLCDEIGRQPLWYACWLPKGDFRIMELLVRHGANPNHIDKNGMSPLSFAKAETKEKLIELTRKMGRAQRNPS